MSYTIPEYRTKTKRTVEPTWSDGFHLVRPATPKDRHPMRWVATYHKGIPSKLLRHAETEQAAIEIAIHATASMKKVVKATEGAKPIKKSRAQSTKPKEPPASSTVNPVTGKVDRRFRPADALPKFSTYHFHCIAANPIAQVWQCHTLPGEKGAVGPRKKDGRPNQQASFNHQRYECAVLLWREPVRAADGSVRVFSRGEAEQYASDAYYETPEDDRLLWREGDKKVFSTEHVDIIFAPEINGEKEPFNLLAWWAPGQSKVVKDSAYQKTSYSKPGRKVGGGQFLPQTPDDAAALAAAKRLADMRSDETRSLSDKDAVFSTIWGAEAYALKYIEPVIHRRRIIKL